MSKIPADRQPFIRGDICYIPLLDGWVALVDAADYDIVKDSLWSLSDGYVARMADGKREPLHRILMPEAPLVDHRNLNKLDNRRNNLRAATSSQSNANRRSWGESQYKGVHKLKRNGYWRVKITHNGKTLSVGCYENEIDAAKAYDEMAKELHGEFAKLNFP